MVFPVAKADPTELFVAHFAMHVVASLVLLNRPGTLGIWTVLGIGNDPINVFAFT